MTVSVLLMESSDEHADAVRAALADSWLAWDVHGVASLGQARDALTQRPFDVALVSYRLTDGAAYDLLTKVVGFAPEDIILDANIFAKAEHLNPGGSIKDRVALFMLEEAKKAGQLKDGDIIAEPTSGNTGIGMALVGGVMGHKVICVMPENMSEERKKLIRCLGADLVLTPAAESLAGAVARVRQMQAEDARVFVPQQFENPDNPRVHYEETARELWRQMNGDIAAFVAGVGSGGTLQGVGTFLKEHKPNAKVVAVEPKNVSALLGHEPGLHQIQGIGDGFIPAVLDISLVDDVIEVSDEDAIETTRQLGRDLGLLVGISTGANVWAARELIARGFEGKIATVLADFTGPRPRGEAADIAPDAEAAQPLYARYWLHNRGPAPLGGLPAVAHLHPHRLAVPGSTTDPVPPERNPMTPRRSAVPGALGALLKARELGLPEGDLSTLEEPA